MDFWIDVDLIGLPDRIQDKLKAGRLKDLADAQQLSERVTAVRPAAAGPSTGS